MVPPNGRLCGGHEDLKWSHGHLSGFLRQTPGRTWLALRMTKAISMFALIAVAPQVIGVLTHEQSETEEQLLAEKAK